jgi:hypothetical protein
MALLGLGFRYGLSARDLQARALRSYADTEIYDQTIRRLVSRIDPGLSNSDPPQFEGGAHAVRFVSGNRIIRVRVVSGTGLVLEYSNPFDTITGGSHIEVSTLLDNVERLDIRYWQPDKGWTDAWTEPRLPALMRFHVVFPEATKRRAPDVIVAPMREMWRS